MFSTAESELSNKNIDFFHLLGIIYVPPIILDSWFFKNKCCCFDGYNLLKFMKMVKCLPEFEYFYCILEK